ncbi:flagellar hook-associated protein FlgK [Alphaproteobacteria bacterium]|nr:flagellar hook-associated protein FlgK [Alphaproteobacteria bacterium]
MTSLFDVGKSAIQAYRQSLAVTGQNIANLNTEGYKRREADLQEVTASQGGIASLANQAGLGVRVSDINRSFDAFLSDKKLLANSNFERMDSYVRQIEKVENALLPSESDLGMQIGNFFRALSDVSASPSDLAPRTVALEQGRSLASAFNSSFMLLDQLKDQTRAKMQDAVDGLNLLTKELASVNSRILSSGQSGKSPNSLLDLRDSLINDISVLTDVSVSYTDRGVANLTIGSSGVGPSLVEGSAKNQIGFFERYDRIGGLQIVLNPLSSKTPTSQLSAGMLAGLSEAYGAIESVINQTNQLAVAITTDLNEQHHRGVAMDGLRGLDMFSSVTVVAEKNPSNPVEVEAEITINDPTILPKMSMTATYNDVQNIWELTGPDLIEPVVGKSVLSAPGFDVRLTGPAINGNSFVIKPGENAAANMRFLLARPQDFAAASPDLVTAANENISEATIEVSRSSPASYPEQKPIADILSNSLTAVEAKEFIHDGFVATIPAGTKSVDIASFAKQTTAKFQLSDLALKNVTQLNFTRNGSSNDGPHSFNISYAAAYPNDTSGGSWKDSVNIAELLNSGLLRSSNNESLSDLGMIASGQGSKLTITSSEGNFETTGAGLPSIATGVGVNNGLVSVAVDASKLHVFTREGRHLSGVAFTDTQIAELMTTANGFNKESVYNAAYLNDTDNAYRGIDTNVSFSGGMYALDIGSNGVAPVLAQGSSILPANSTTAYTMTVDLSHGASHNVSISAGSSAASAALAINKVLQNSGIKAKAKTQVELFDFQSSGVVTFDLEAANRIPVEISANVTSTNLNNLAIAINNVSADTGVSAVTSSDYSRIILTSDTGDDIAVSSLSIGSPSFSGRLVNEDGVALSTPVGTVTSAGAFKDAMTTTNVVSDSLVAGVNVSTSSAAGAGANLSLTRDTSGSYSVAITGGGAGVASPYVVGDTFSIDGSIVSGSTSTHDVTITVTSIDANGVITGASASGLAPGLTQPQTTITPTMTSGLGNGASFDITMSDGVATVAVNAVGSGYDVGDTVTILGSSLGGTDGVNDLTLTVATLASSSMVSFGSVVSGNTIDTARFSGSLVMQSSESFSITTASGTTNAAQDAALGGFVNVKSNVTGDTKLVTFDVSTALETGGAALDGLRAIAPNATYSINIPTGNNAISFSADVNAKELSAVSGDAVNQALIKEVRDQAPLVSLSAGSTISTSQVVSYSFQRTEAVVPSDDSVTLQINGTMVAVDLNDIDGLGNSASSAADVTTAIVRAVNNAGLGITATTSASAPNYGVILTANTAGEVFTVDSFSFNDLNETTAQTQFSLQSETAAKSLPSDGTAVSIDFGSQVYQLKMQNGEVVVSGPEASRVTAYFDSDSRLQVFGGGSLMGAPLTVASDTKIAGNSAAAAAFGLTTTTTRLAGQIVTLSSGMDDLSLKFDGADVSVSLSLAGVITTNPSSISGLTLRWDAATANTGRLIAEYDSTQNTLSVAGPTNALGFKTADREVSLQNDAIKVQSTDKTAFALTANATSIAGTRLTLDGLPNEDLLVFVTGGGARSIAAEYELPVKTQDLTTYEIRSVGDTGNMLEIWDADTGHSIATRVVSGNRQTNFGEFEVTVRGKLEDGDKFTLQQDAAGTSDARNLELIIALQNGDQNGLGKLGFQEMFGVMIAGVGSSVRSGMIAVQVQEENLMAAKEAESEFSGVNLDIEAAALLEYQQAYQASARILSTARELFQSLMEVV